MPLEAWLGGDVRGGLARTSAQRSGVGRSASVRSIQHSLGTQRAPSHLPPALPPFLLSRTSPSFQADGNILPWGNVRNAGPLAILSLRLKSMANRM